MNSWWCCLLRSSDRFEQLRLCYSDVHYRQSRTSSYSEKGKPCHQGDFSETHMQGTNERQTPAPPPAVSGWLLAWNCSWWRISLNKFSSTRLTLPQPIGDQDSEYMQPCPLLPPLCHSFPLPCISHPGVLCSICWPHLLTLPSPILPHFYPPAPRLIRLPTTLVLELCLLLWVQI